MKTSKKTFRPSATKQLDGVLMAKDQQGEVVLFVIKMNGEALQEWKDRHIVEIAAFKDQKI